MLTDPTTDVTASARPWWDRALDPVGDFLDRVLFPIDEFVAPKVERYQAETAHRLASNARRYAEIHAVRSWSFYHHTRAHRLHAWACAESAVEHTRAGLHAQHAGRLDDSDGCCAPLIRLYRDRAELIRALAVMEGQTVPVAGRSPNFGAMPGRMRRLAGDRLAAMASTYSKRERGSIAESLVDQLKPEIGAAIDPLRRVYVG